MLKLLTIGIVATALATAVGCSPTPVKPGAAMVQVTNIPPSKECRFLGDITAGQGNRVSGRYTSNSNLETGARNDMKNQAAAMGGNFVYLLTSRAGQTGSGLRTEQTNVTLSGNVYVCPSSPANNDPTP